MKEYPISRSSRSSTVKLNTPDGWDEIETALNDARIALVAERERADRAEAALSRLLDAHDVHVEMDKTLDYECPQCRHEAK